jgi:uncharacterized Zn finger protein
MIRLLQLLFLGHFHRWKTIECGPFHLTENGRVTDRGVRYIQQCETCGVVVKRDLI